MNQSIRFISGWVYKQQVDINRMLNDPEIINGHAEDSFVPTYHLLLGYEYRGDMIFAVVSRISDKLAVSLQEQIAECDLVRMTSVDPLIQECVSFWIQAKFAIDNLPDHIKNTIPAFTVPRPEGIPYHPNIRLISPI
jgi:hypothetical protein